VLLSTHASAEPELIWHETFDSRIVKTSRLQDLDRTTGKRPAFPLRAVMTRKSIYLLDERGAMASRIPLEKYDKAAMSDDGCTMAALKGRHITISSVEGHVCGVAGIADPHPEVLPEHADFELSPEGTYVVLLSYLSDTICFHDRTGRLVARHAAQNLNGTEVKFSADGRYVVIHIPNWSDGTSSGYLLCFNAAGRLLWRYDHPGCEAAFDVSQDGSVVVVAAGDKLCSLGEDGSRICEKEVSAGYTHVSLSATGGQLAATSSSDRRLDMLDSRSGRVLWSERIPEFDPRKSAVNALAISADSACVAVAVNTDCRRTAREATVYAYNGTGTQTWQNSVDSNDARVFLSPHATALMVVAGSRINGHIFME